MKRIKLMIIHQKGKEFYTLVCDPRELIKLVEIPEPKTGQKAQRPWVEKKVKEIAEYVAGRANISEDKEQEIRAKGIIPNSPILNVKSPMRIIRENGEVLLEFPETEEEFNRFSGCIEIIDGQHRIFSFMEKFRDIDFKDTEIYEMAFNIFLDLTISEVRELFMISNDKQDKVEPNVLREMKKLLNLLTSKQDRLYDLAISLNEETISPLKDKIIVGGNKIKNGFKLVQVVKILEKSKTFEIISKLDENAQIQIISIYLKGWQRVYNNQYGDNTHTLGKIAGFRYIMYLFPYISEILKETKKEYREESVEEVIKNLYMLTNGEEMFKDEKIRLAFRGEGGTTSLAKANGILLKSEMNKNTVFDPFARY